LLSIYVDASKSGAGNTPTSCAVVVQRNGKVVFNYASELDWRMTINEAEYRAVICGIHAAIDMNEDAIIFSDSKLAVQQLNGKWKQNVDRLIALNKEAQELMRNTDLKIKIRFTEREKNILADSLAQNLTKGLK
jgi:ribonuclease HI